MFFCTLLLVLAVVGFISFVGFLLVSDCDLTLKSKSLNPKYFEGKVVWITGASSGIGKALALALAPMGAKLILSSRKKQRLNEIRDTLLTEYKNNVAVVPLDLEDLSNLKDKSQMALSQFGRIDMLVNNGGISTRYLGKDGDFESDMKVTTIDYLGQVVCTKQVINSMIRQKSGHIINISSIAGKMGAPLRTAYCGAKWALIGYMDALRTEIAHDGLYVTNICPGSVQTDVSINALKADGSSFGVTDPNIGSGITVNRCAELILIATSNKIHEAWIAKGKELLITYLHQYMPTVGKSITIKFARQLIKHTLEEKKQ